ncbi:NADH-quinone oxidoreductase subunit C [Polynucleobacter sp.]|mgnify:FL=1|uniref:NADH-quinone oxidoreductase subunit C n=1 Tax=Polynucleobacter sp. TaxID=2029855 RepID=UPI0027371889|nr:NADH-quinone oxidoreductase subunit C [Polynucleobacter sp.]MDP3121455.1 NADH-quinone oxidoreductase subunit C [Polynucleobacter sp.]
MSERLIQLQSHVERALGARVKSITLALNELTVVLRADTYLESALILRDDPALGFEQLIDLCGVDYQDYLDGTYSGPRFAVVTHLLSVKHNLRLRLRVFAPDDSYPLVSSLTSVWASANWFEREAFDLFGILFDGHADLRRILTDYGFIGHPFRKDFPISGNVEMRYDPELQRVVYQPVTIETREVTPRVVREEQYGGPV